MRNITEEARRVMNTRRDFVNYAHVTLHDGTELNLTPSDFRISGNSFTDDWNEGEDFQLGSAIGKTATLLLDNTDGRTEEISNGISKTYPHGKFSEYDFYMAFFELYIHLPDSTHYNGELIDEVIPIGTFTVTTPASHGATIEITGVDNMYMFDRSFDDCTLDFDNNGNGQTLITILNRCCDDCGVIIGYSSFLNQNLKVYKKPEGVTYREVVSYIAQIAGCNAVISVTGALTLKYYDMSPINEILDGGYFNPWTGVDTTTDTVDGGSFNPWTETDPIISGGDFTTSLRYHNLTATNGTTVSTDDIHFTGIEVFYEVDVDGSTETQSIHHPNTTGWDEYTMQITDNPFVTINNASTIATSVWDKLKDLNFRVFSCSSIQDPTIEAGDCALVYDVKGNIYPTIITNVTFKTGGMTDIKCTAQPPVKQNSRYVNPAARAVARAKENMDAYNTQVAYFNEIANAALGYYKTEEVDADTGATITYLHEKSTLASSANVVKIAGGVVAISDNYNTPQRSWNSGVDLTTATMLMNLIYVHGLTADWIKTGTLTLGGFNNIDGILTAYANTQIGTGTWSSGNADVNITYASVGSVEGTFPASIYIDSISSAATFKGRYTLYLTTNGGSSWTTIETKALKAGENKISSVTIQNNASRYYRVRLNQYSGGSGTYRYRVNVNRVVTTIDRNGVTTTNGTFSGKIQASTGNIGPWTIVSSAIYKSNSTWGSSSGMYFGNDGLSVKDKFKVSSAGALTSTSGSIAGITINENGLGGRGSSGQMNAIHLDGGDFGVSVNRTGSSWGALCFGDEAASRTGWSKTCCVLWNGGDAAAGFHVCNGAPDNTDDFSAMKMNTFQIWIDGDLEAYFNESGPHPSSDRRRKKNIKNLAVSKVRNFFKEINPISFKYKNKKRTDVTHCGIIAQELQDVLEKSGLGLDAFVETAEDDSLFVNYQEFHGLELAAIKDLYALVNAQQEEINTLKQEVELLKQLVNTK